MWHLGGLESASNPKANRFTLKVLDCLNHLPKKRNDWEMTIWDGRGELGFKIFDWIWTFGLIRVGLSWSWNGPLSVARLKRRVRLFDFSCKSTCTENSDWLWCNSYRSFLEKTKGIWKTAHPCITCTEVSHIFLSASDWTQCSFASDIAGTSASPASPASPGHEAPTRLRLTSGSGWPTSNFNPRINWAQWCPQMSLLAQTPWQNKSRDFDASWNA